MIDTDALSGARDLARRERPLEGLRVLEFGSLIAGPFATRIMAEFGERARAAGVGEVVLAATEDLVYMITEMGIETGVALEPLMDPADLLERLVGHPLNTRIERSLLADSGLR